MTASRLARAALVLASVASLALVALVLALPRLVDRPELRRVAEQSAERVLGRRVGYERPSVGLLPPALVLERPWIAGAREGSDALLEAERLALELELRPLLARRVVVRSVELVAPVLRVARGARGLELPGLPSAGGSPDGRLHVARVKLVRGTLVLRDTVVAPPVTSELRDLELELEPGDPGEPLTLRGSFRLGGGRVDVAGTAGAGGALDLELGLDALPLGAHAAYFSLAPAALAARVDGRLRLRRSAAGPLGVEGRVALRDGLVRLGGVEIGRGARAQVALDGIPDALRGRFELDARTAEVAWPGYFAKPAGLPGALSAQLRRTASAGLSIEGAQLRVGELRARGEALLAAGRVRLALRSERVDAGALAAIVPDVARIPGIGGSLVLRALELETDPLVLVADVELERLSLSPGTPAPLLVHGPIALRGKTARAEGLVAEIGGQPMTLDGEVSLGDAPSYALRGRMRGADAMGFVAGVLPRPPRVEGRLDLDADLRGPLDSRSVVASVEGSLRVHVADGRIAGVSVFERALSAFSSVERLSGISRILGRDGAAGSSAEGAGDRFRTLDATLRQARGISRTDDLRIVHPGYVIALAGELRALEGTLTMHGDILLGEGLVGPIGKGLGLVGLGCAMPNRIPIPEVSGPLSDPRVRPDASYVLGFVTRCSPLDRLKAVGKGILEAPRALGRGSAGKQEAETAQPPGPETGEGR